MKEWLKGRKTYIAAAGAALTAVAAWLGDAIDTPTLIQNLLEAAAIATLRAGVASVTQEK